MFIDFKKAFDVIDHTILIKKLSYYGLSETCVRFLESFLCNREQCVSFNKEMSVVTTIERGVPQGSVLGPLLFSIYINDLPLNISDGECDMFADDTSIHVSDRSHESVISKLQLSATQAFQWASCNKMDIHPDKTKFMIITTRQKHQRLPTNHNSIIVNGHKITRVSETRFLGLIVDDKLSWSNHIHNLTSSIAKAVYQLARIKNFIDERCRKSFYHAYIHSKLQYGLLIFGGAAANQVRPLKSLQKRALRLIVKHKLNLHDDIFQSLNILPFISLLNFQRSLIIFKSLRKETPLYVQKLFIISEIGNNRFKLSLPRIDIYKNQSVSFSAVNFWNSLPMNFRNYFCSLSLATFKFKLKAQLLSST